MTVKVSEAFQSISGSRARVDAVDDYLREVVRRVVSVLSSFRPVAVEVPYTVDGTLRSIQLRQSRDIGWYVAWQQLDPIAPFVALLSAPRAVRVEVFTVMPWPGHETPIAPLEALVVAVSNALSTEATDRGPLMDVARRLEALIGTAAGDTSEDRCAHRIQ